MCKKLMFALALLFVSVIATATAATPRVTADGGGEGHDAPQEQILRAVVAYVADEYEIEVMGQQQMVQKLELIVKGGDRRGEEIVVEHRVQPYAGQEPYREGDQVYVSDNAGQEAGERYYIVGYARWSSLLWLALLFVALVLLVGRGQGVRSLLGLTVSFAIIFLLVLPRLSRGQSPLAVALIGAALTMPLNYYLAHGLNRKSTVALAGSLIGLAATGLLAELSISLAHLSGYASDAAGFLQSAAGARQGAIDVQGLLLGGIIIGVLGVLDDITVSQAAIVMQLRKANRSLGWRQLYARAMAVGQDHIASMVNTLMLVYAGSALPLLLLLSDRSLPLLYIISHEVVAEEVVRILVTSSGLVAAVPITTLLAAVVSGWEAVEE